MPEPRDPLADQLRAWADAADPITPAEVRRRATGLDGRRRPPTRTLLLAAAVLALVAGVVGVTVLRDDDTTPVETIDGPSTTTATTEVPGPTTTSAPPTTTDTTLPGNGGPGAEQPAQWVGVDDQHRLVVVDTATGDVIRVLVTFDDPEAFGDDGEEPVAGGNFAGPIDLSPDGQTVYYETCCEPAAGLVFRVPITGGEPEQVAMGTNPAVSPDGTKLAVVDLGGIAIVDLATEEAARHQIADLDRYPMVREVTWSPDGSQLAFVTYDADQSWDVAWVATVAELGDDLLAASREVALPDELGAPTSLAFVDDQRLTFVRQAQLQPGEGPRAPDVPSRIDVLELTDPPTLLVRDLEEVPAREQDLDASATFRIVVRSDGTVALGPVGGWPGAATGPQVVEGRWTAAAW